MARFIDGLNTHSLTITRQQAINEVAIQIAGRYIVNAPMWLEAAKNLRVPYWDWAGPIPAGEPDIPSEITSTTVDITTPEGIKTVKNPLYWFPFPSKFPYTSFPSPHYSWGTTLRYPSSDQPNAECRMDVLSGYFLPMFPVSPALTRCVALTPRTAINYARRLTTCSRG